MRKAGGGLERVEPSLLAQGELAYLMLSRASEALREELRRLLGSHFDYQSPHNRLLMRFIEEDLRTAETFGRGLTYRTGRIRHSTASPKI